MNPAALVLKQGLNLESPGVKTMQMLPPRSIDRLSGEGTGDVISKYSRCNTSGKLHGNHTANISSKALRCLQIWGESGPHSKLWFSCGAHEMASLTSFLLVQMLLLRPISSSTELELSGRAHLRPLSSVKVSGKNFQKCRFPGPDS